MEDRYKVKVKLLESEGQAKASEDQRAAARGASKVKLQPHLANGHATPTAISEYLRSVVCIARLIYVVVKMRSCSTFLISIHTLSRPCSGGGPKGGDWASLRAIHNSPPVVHVQSSHVFQAAIWASHEALKREIISTAIAEYRRCVGGKHTRPIAAKCLKRRPNIPNRSLYRRRRLSSPLWSPLHSVT